MTSASKTGCERTACVAEYALQALPANERAGFEAHVEQCRECRLELEALRPITGAFVDWPIDVLRPPTPLWDRLAQRIANNAEAEPPVAVERGSREEPGWKEVAPGISCKLLATDRAKERVSMLVRLAPGVAYPPHSHAGVEELHLLEGELWINDRKLSPGDYNRAEPGTMDNRVWSETGCTCVLLTSFTDTLR
jgi:quercetin dioxygenase-like cupin family protein